MSRLDVRELKHEKLSPGRFPGDVSSDFRLHMAAKVHQGITQHAKQDATVEICGVLVGGWETDDHGPYCVVSDLIRCEQAASKFAEVTFTHESWSQINKEMDTKFGDKRIVGWYHSHPDFGIFLSERDCFIHEHFFSGPGQVAFVTDPVRDLEGVFAWRNGKPELMPHFWIGETIRGAEASRVPAQGKAAEHGGGAAASGVSTAPSAEASYLGLLTTVLAWLCLFLLGYLWAGLQSSWDRRILAEGIIANFGDLTVLHQGLENDLAAVRDRVAAITEELKKLPDVDATKEPERAKEVAQKRQDLLTYLDGCKQSLRAIEQKYGYTEEVRAALSREFERRVAAMREAQPTKAAGEAAKDGKAAGESKDAGDGKGKGPATKTDVPAGKAGAQQQTAGGDPPKQADAKGAK